MSASTRGLGGRGPLPSTRGLERMEPPLPSLLSTVGVTDELGVGVGVEGSGFLLLAAAFFLSSRRRGRRRGRGSRDELGVGVGVEGSGFLLLAAAFFLSSRRRGRGSRDELAVGFWPRRAVGRGWRFQVRRLAEESSARFRFREEKGEKEK